MARGKRLYGTENPTLHQKAKLAAALLDLNLQDFVDDAVEEKLARMENERDELYRRIVAGNTQIDPSLIHDNDGVERAR